MQTSKATKFWSTISSYQEKDAYAHTCKDQFSGGGGKLPRPGYLHPRGASCPEAASPRRGQAAQGGARYPGVSSSREASCPEAASPPGGGGRWGKLPRVQDKPVHRLKRCSIFKLTRIGSVLCILHHWGVQLILAYSWARPAILVVGKGRGGMFLFLLFLHFHSCSSFFPVPLPCPCSSTLSSISFLPFSGRRHKMTLKGWRVVKPQHNQSKKTRIGSMIPKEIKYNLHY